MMIMMGSVIFAIVFFLNLFLISAGSSGAVPFGKRLRLSESQAKLRRD
jgi:transmembrane 9 superfamily protein 2/4